MSYSGWRIGVVFSLAAGFFAGCGKAEPWEVVYPATGTVSYKGKPLAGALITLIPQDEAFPGKVRPSATSREDGTFELGTYSAADGAPAGDYKALVLHFPVVGSKENPSPGKNDLPRKYAAEKTTDLLVTVSEEPTELDPLVIDE